MRKALKHVRDHVPFFSAGSMLENEGIRYPIGMGGTCLLQARVLKDELTKRNINSRILKAINTPHPFIGHRTVVAFEEGRVYFVDPTIIQACPIDLTRVLETGTPTIFTPDFDRGASGREYILSPGEEGTSSTSFYLDHILDPYNIGDPKLMRRDLFDYEIEDDGKNKPSIKKSKIQLVVIDPDTRELLGIHVLVESNLTTASILGKAQHQLGTPEFDRIIRRISELTDTKVEDIIGILKLSQTIYARMDSTHSELSQVMSNET